MYIFFSLTAADSTTTKVGESKTSPTIKIKSLTSLMANPSASSSSSSSPSLNSNSDDLVPMDCSEPASPIQGNMKCLIFINIRFMTHQKI